MNINSTPSFYSFVAVLVLFMGLFTFNGDRVDALGYEIGTTSSDATMETSTNGPTSEGTTVLMPATPRVTVGLEGMNTMGSALPSSILSNSILSNSSFTRSNSNSLLEVDARTWDTLPKSMRPKVDDETLWLARVIYSETKRPEEQELVAWVVRNRVETEFRNNNSYRDVVLDPYQFSAFNPGSRKRKHYSSLGVHSTEAGWQKALRIAYEVKNMPATFRPFDLDTRHFYSEQSMVGRKHPAWASGKSPVKPARPYALNAKRFRFFSDIT